MILAITKGIVPPDAHRSNNGAEFLIWRIFKTRHRWDGWRNEFDVVVGQAMRRRRTSYVPTQSGRTGPTTAETSKLVNLVRNLSGSPPKSGILSTEINGILYSEISGILWGEISIIQCCWSGDAPEAHKLRQRRTGNVRGAQVPPEADR
jgi:hypothetical protein